MLLYLSASSFRARTKPRPKEHVLSKHCWKCGWNGGGHDPVCPELIPANRADYDRGYSRGRAGKPKESDSPAYSLGWLKGESALEAAENGSDRPIY